VTALITASDDPIKHLRWHIKPERLGGFETP
jgi:hypothetical protein